MDNKHSSGRTPFAFAIGEELRVMPTHSADDKELGFNFLGIRLGSDLTAMREEALKEGKTSIERSFKFTGDLAKDRALADKFLPPHFTLVQIPNGPGYYLAIGPRHTNFSNNYMSLEMIRRRILKGRPVPESLKKHLKQQNQFNVMETIRQQSEYGVYD